MEAAQQFLDGQPIETQAQADDVGQLLGKLREARQGADAQRKIEKAPHDEAAKAVQAAWVPLLDRVALAEQVAKRALAPFLTAQEAIAQAAAAKAREEAQLAAQVAQRALGDCAAYDLAGREEAERLLKLAGKADRAAGKAEKAKPMAAGLGRAVSLRSVWTPSLVDPMAALRHYRETQPEALKTWLFEQAHADVRAGKREIPGFTVTEEKVAQ